MKGNNTEDLQKELDQMNDELKRGIYKYVYDGKIIYIGKANSKRGIPGRIYDHAREDKFNPYLDKCKIYYIPLPTSAEVDGCEPLLINKYKPILNSQFNYSNKPIIDVESQLPKWKDYDKAAKRITDIESAIGNLKATSFKPPTNNSHTEEYKVPKNFIKLNSRENEYYDMDEIKLKIKSLCKDTEEVFNAAFESINPEMRGIYIDPKILSNKELNNSVPVSIYAICKKNGKTFMKSTGATCLFIYSSRRPEVEIEYRLAMALKDAGYILRTAT